MTDSLCYNFTLSIKLMLLVARVIKVLIYKVMFLQTLSFADHALIILGAQTHFTSLPQKKTIPVVKSAAWMAFFF